MIPIVVRPMNERDMPFILANWLNHYKNFSSFAKRIRKDIFFNWHHKIVKNILSRPTCETLVAHPKDEPEVILGYLVKEKWPDGPVIHFMFVKEVFRKIGIARTLLEESKVDLNQTTFTHWTYDMDALTIKHPNLTYNPYKI